MCYFRVLGRSGRKACRSAKDELIRAECQYHQQHNKYDIAHFLLYFFSPFLTLVLPSHPFPFTPPSFSFPVHILCYSVGQSSYESKKKKEVDLKRIPDIERWADHALISCLKVTYPSPSLPLLLVHSFFFLLPLLDEAQCHSSHSSHSSH